MAIEIQVFFLHKKIHSSDRSATSIHLLSFFTPSKMINVMAIIFQIVLTFNNDKGSTTHAWPTVLTSLSLSLLSVSALRHFNRVKWRSLINHTSAPRRLLSFFPFLRRLLRPFWPFLHALTTLTWPCQPRQPKLPDLGLPNLICSTIDCSIMIMMTSTHWTATLMILYSSYTTNLSMGAYVYQY